MASRNSPLSLRSPGFERRGYGHAIMKSVSARDTSISWEEDIDSSSHDGWPGVGGERF